MPTAALTQAVLSRSRSRLRGDLETRISLPPSPRRCPPRPLDIYVFWSHSCARAFQRRDRAVPACAHSRIPIVQSHTRALSTRPPTHLAPLCLETNGANGCTREQWGRRGVCGKMEVEGKCATPREPRCEIKWQKPVKGKEAAALKEKAKQGEKKTHTNARAGVWGGGRGKKIRRPPTANPRPPVTLALGGPPAQSQGDGGPRGAPEGLAPWSPAAETAFPASPAEPTVYNDRTPHVTLGTIKLEQRLLLFPG